MRTCKKTSDLPRAALALALALGLCLPPTLPAGALGAVDTTKTGSLTFQLPADTPGETDGMIADLAENKAAITVELYQVADIGADGRFTVAAVLGPEEGKTPESGSFADLVAQAGVDDYKTAAYWEKATAQLLREIYGEEGLETAGDGTVPTVKEDAEPRLTGLTSTQPRLTGENSYTVEADGLAPGLYLAVPKPVRTRRYAYTFTPMLLALPLADPAKPDGDTATATDSWLYDYAATLKPSRTKQLGRLLLEKELDGYNPALGPVTFVFEITARLGDEVAYSNVAELTFSAAGKQQLCIDGLPVGAAVTVREVYSGASYELTAGNETQTVTVPALFDAPAPDAGWVESRDDLPEGADHVTAARVYFKNTYKERLIPSIAVDNVFTYREAGGWEWHQKGPDTPTEGGDRS